MGASIAPRQLAVRFLLAGVILQGGFVATAYFVGRAVGDLSEAALRLMADAPAADTADAIAWLGRHDAVASGMMPALMALFAGYTVAAVVAWYLSRPVRPAPGSAV